MLLIVTATVVRGRLKSRPRLFLASYQYLTSPSLLALSRWPGEGGVNPELGLPTRESGESRNSNASLAGPVRMFALWSHVRIHLERRDEYSVLMRGGRSWGGAL